MLRLNLQCVVAPSPPLLIPVPPDALPVASINWGAPPRPFPAALSTFLHTLRVGLSWSSALAALSYLPHEQFSTDGRIFCTPAVGFPGGLPDSRLPLCDPADTDALTLFFSCSAIVAICSSHSVLPLPNSAPSAGLSILSTGAPSPFFPNTSGSRRLQPVTSCPSSWLPTNDTSG